MWKPQRLFLFYATAFLVGVLIAGCGLVEQIVQPKVGADWSPLLSTADIGEVQATFPQFVPDLFAPGYSIGDNLSPSNFAPAEFFGPPNSQGFQPTAMGILVETNGYDGEKTPAHFPVTGTYFDLNGNPFQFALTTFSRSPQNILERYMGVPLTPNAPTILIDLSTGRVTATYIDEFMVTLQAQLANALPAIQKVDITSCQIKIEPSLLYVSNGGSSGYAGGVTESLGGGKYLSHIAAMEMNSPQDIANWPDYLVDEGLNCLVAAAGRPDLEH
jgi:hypothetical protein